MINGLRNGRAIWNITFQVCFTMFLKCVNFLISHPTNNWSILVKIQWWNQFNCEVSNWQQTNKYFRPCYWVLKSIYFSNGYTCTWILKTIFYLKFVSLVSCSIPVYARCGNSWLALSSLRRSCWCGRAAWWRTPLPGAGSILGRRRTAARTFRAGQKSVRGPCLRMKINSNT